MAQIYPVFFHCLTIFLLTLKRISIQTFRNIKKTPFKVAFHLPAIYLQIDNVGMLIENRKTTFLIYVTDHYTGLLLQFHYHLKDISTVTHCVDIYSINLYMHV